MSYLLIRKQCNPLKISHPDDSGTLMFGDDIAVSFGNVIVL